MNPNPRYHPKQDYVPANAADFAAFVDELVMARYLKLATLREWTDTWPQAFKSAVWQKLHTRTKEVIKLMQG